VEIVLPFLIVGVVVGGFLGWRLRRRHRGVPLGWQTAQSEAADLHRRLHRCVDRTRREVARAGARGAPVDRVKALTDDLEAQARGIDTQLVAASKLPSGRRQQPLRDCRYRVIEMERLADRVASVAADLTGPVLDAADAGLRDLRERLDALDAARREAHDIAAGRAEPEPPGAPQPGTA
jgi:hypothetical protein